MSCNLRQPLLPAVLALALLSCAKAPDSITPRYAFARFENLTGDPSLDWVARVSADCLARSLGGSALSPAALNRAAGNMVSSDRAKATLAGATHLVSGSVEKAGSLLRLEATDEDLATHATTRILAAQAAQPIPALQELARQLSSSPKPLPTTNPEALRLYASAFDKPAAETTETLHEATRIDPDFSLAWLGIAELNPTEANVDAALTHKLNPIDKAALRVLKAAIDKDKPARVAALRDLAALTPADLTLRKSLAENETAMGQFAQAAADWKIVGEAIPTDRDAWNQRGYALAWTGDFNAALDAMKSYAARWPEDVNPLDSTGDVNYLAGRFADAASWYLKAQQKNPQFLAGGDLYKAASAQFRAGDRRKADASFEQFRAARAKQNPPAFSLLEADWLARTGREKEAIAMLRRNSNAASQTELIVLDLLSHDRAAAAQDSRDLAPQGLGLIVRFAALPSASAPEWQARADNMLKGPQGEAIRPFALAVALALDGKKEAALPLWQNIAAESTATDFVAQTIVARLKGEKPRFPLLPDPNNTNALALLAEKL